MYVAHLWSTALYVERHLSISQRFCWSCGSFCMGRVVTALVVTDVSSLCVSCVPLNPLSSLPGIKTRSLALPPLLACHPLWPSATLINCTYTTNSLSRFFLSEFLNLNAKRLWCFETSETTQRQSVTRQICLSVFYRVYEWNQIHYDGLEMLLVRGKQLCMQSFISIQP